MTRKITPEEKKLWKLVTRGVKGGEVDDFIEEAPVRVALTPLREMLPEKKVEKKLPVELFSNTRNAMDAGNFEKLRRGKHRPQARIDLHGLWLADAHNNVRDFLQMSHAAGKRCVLVITGKGGIRGDGKIRSEFPKWINDIELRSIILSFSQATPADGGAGAFYVYLRK